jgi:hypothetical protein
MSARSPAFPEARNPMEWIPFHGTFTSSSSSSSCGGSTSVTGFGSTEGSYGCPSYTTPSTSGASDDNKGRDNGSNAPGKGEKPAPSPKPDPKPAPSPAPAPPPAEPPPSNGGLGQQ